VQSKSWHQRFASAGASYTCMAEKIGQAKGMKAHVGAGFKPAPTAKFSR
jgi:hypothetical protein